MIARDVFSEEHDLFRASVRRFVEKELVPHHAEWEAAHQVSRDAWLKASATDAGIETPACYQTGL